jgi:hypothetical protein
MDSIPTGAFLAPYPAAVREHAATLRATVRRAVPDVIERVRPGWQLIGYDLPIGRRTSRSSPGAIHIHLGFEHGVAMADPQHARGCPPQAQEGPLTFRPDEVIPEDLCPSWLRGRAAALPGPAAALAWTATLHRRRST